MKEAMEIVSLVKEYKITIQHLLNCDDINFLGCSEDYVEEKINALINELQYLKKHLRSVEKQQSILAKNKSTT